MKWALRAVVGRALCTGLVPDPDPKGPSLTMAALLCSAPEQVVCPRSWGAFAAVLGQVCQSFSLWVATE